MKPIPELRQELYQLSLQLPFQHRTKIEEIIMHMWRKPAVKKARPTAQHMTPEIGDAIRTWAFDHPNETNRSIASRFGVDAGRVSEALNGRWL